MQDMKIHRWNRIFRPDGKTFILAIDHAAVFGMMPGLEKPGELLRQAVAGGADAVLTTYGIASRFGKEIGSMGLILRVDGGASNLSKDRGPMDLIYTVDDALRLGADAVGAMGLPGSTYEGETMPYLAELVSQCAEWNVPVLAEMLPGGFENPAEWWTPDNIGHACRIGAELGVDIIKTNYTGDATSWRRVTDQVYAPIVVLGGSKSKDPLDLLKNIHESMSAGANGVAVGRNIYQYEHPDKMMAAIAALVHANATVDAAAAYLK